MWNIENKVDYDATSKGKLYSRELNLISKSGNRIMISAGDKRAGDDNENSLLGAIDDISKIQLFNVVNNALVRVVPLNDSGGDDVFIPSDGMLMHIFSDTTTPLVNTVSVNGVSYTMTIDGNPAADMHSGDGIILIGKIDTGTHEIKMFSTGGNYTIDEILTPTTNSTLSITKPRTLLQVPSTDTQVKSGIMLTLTLPDTGVDEIIIENAPTTSTYLKVTELILSKPVRGVDGDKLYLDRMKFRIKIINENNEYKLEVV